MDSGSQTLAFPAQAAGFAPQAPGLPPRADQPRPSGAPFEHCLALCSAFAGSPLSPVSVAAGLPRTDTGLGREAFERAAERARLRLSRLESADELLAHLREGDGVIVAHQDAYAVLRRSPSGVHIYVPSPGLAPEPEHLLPDQARQACAAGGWRVQPDFLARAPSTDTAEPDRFGWMRRAVLAQRRTYFSVGLASMVANLLMVLSSFYTMQVYDRVVPNNAFETLWALSIGVALIYTFDLLMRLLRSFMIDYAGKRLDLEISARLFEKVVGLRMAQRPNSAGVFANQLNDFESIRDFFTSLTLTAVIDLPFVLLYLAVMVYIGGPVGWVPVLTIALMLGTTLVLRGPMDRAMRASMQASAQKHGMLIETLAGIEALKLSAAEGVFQGAWERAVRSIAASSMRSKLLSNVGSSLTGFWQSIAGVALVVVGVYEVSHQRLTLGGLIACSILMSRALAPMGQLAMLLSRWSQTKVALGSVTSLLKRQVERPAGKTFLVRERIAGDVQFQGVTFSYTGAPTPALRGVSFGIRAGERVAIIGRSGSGKSTIAKLLTGLYEPAEGTVQVGGVDTRQIDPHQLRRSIAAVPQDPFLFNGTVRENIAYGDDLVDDASLIRVAQEAGVDEFVKTHPLGYDLPVGERGALLSGGQRQAVVLARALTGSKSILLLDEPSSSLDSVAEQHLRKRLLTLCPGETLILITHRLQMLEVVDRVIVLHEGQVLVDGPRDEVLQKLNGRSAP